VDSIPILGTGKLDLKQIKTLALTLIGVPVIALWYGRRKVAWRTLLALVLLTLFVVFPLYNAYRWSNPRFSRGERLSATVQRIQDWDTTQYMRFSIGGFKRRMALINSVAVVVRDPESAIDENGIIQLAKDSLANFKVPKRVMFVDELPRNSMAKVQKNIIRENYSDLFA